MLTAYNKPPVITQQLLEPERAKELSRSTPVLLSEVVMSIEPLKLIRCMLKMSFLVTDLLWGVSERTLRNCDRHSQIP